MICCRLRPLHCWPRMAARPRGLKTPGSDLEDHPTRSAMTLNRLCGAARRVRPRLWHRCRYVF
eukprot:8838612-Pyramimonas_sp.AAC.1